MLSAEHVIRSILNQRKIPAPIVGDFKYGFEADDISQGLDDDRILLHSYELSFYVSHLSYPPLEPREGLTLDLHLVIHY